MIGYRSGSGRPTTVIDGDPRSSPEAQSGNAGPDNSSYPDYPLQENLRYADLGPRGRRPRLMEVDRGFGRGVSFAVSDGYPVGTWLGLIPLAASGSAW